MKQIILLMGLGLLTGLAPITRPAGNEPAGPALSPAADRLVDFLVKDWGQRFHSTTIPHAMENLGMKIDDDLRLEVVEHFRNNRSLSRNLRSWGANNYVLTNGEKRVAKLLINTRRDTGKLPSAAVARKTLGLSKSDLNAKLAFMARAGFLKTDRSESLGYGLAADANIWGGPLRHNYHTITVGGEDKFDVW